ncbi:hypothetical protein ACWCYZ_46235 [Streptomyces virginiae]
MVAVAGQVGELLHGRGVTLRGEQFCRHRVARDDEQVGGRYVELEGEFDDYIGGGIGSVRGEITEDIGSFHARKAAVGLED